MEFYYVFAFNCSDISFICACIFVYEKGLIMTTKEMKELYATGEWICVINEIGDSYHFIEEPEWEFDTFEYKLIHIKHKEVLYHVLNGGMVRRFVNTDRTKYEAETEVSFFREYDSEVYYDIIPTKQSLNGHYCLATKEHYEQLVKDGYKNDVFNTFEAHSRFLNGKYIGVLDGMVSLFDRTVDEKPMHHHNNQWYFGSLEHGEEQCITMAGYCATCRQEARNCWCPEPPKRITRQTAIDEMHYESFEVRDYINKLFDYIEYLEANQKD